MGNISICQYAVEKVTSNRTHANGIDVNFDGTRIFLNDEQGKSLIELLIRALVETFKEPTNE